MTCNIYRQHEQFASYRAQSQSLLEEELDELGVNEDIDVSDELLTGAATFPPRPRPRDPRPRDPLRSRPLPLAGRVDMGVPSSLA